MTNSTDFDLEYQEATAPTQPADPTRGMEKRFEGKTREDVIDMQLNLERLLNRQGNELGQLRRTVDQQTQLINQRILSDNTKPEAKVTAESILANPEAAVRTVVSPEIQRTNERLDKVEVDLARQDFENKNPNYISDVNTKDFQDWVLGSRTRANLLQKLNNYDFGAGSELWELWDEHQRAAKASENARQSRVSAAVTTIKQSAGEPKGKPTYSRAKLAELQIRAMNGDMAAKARWEDPAFQAEYQAAYAEDRVR